jgi:hypothetical protein
MTLEEAQEMLKRISCYHDLDTPGTVVLDGHFTLLELKAIVIVAEDLWLRDLGKQRR